MTPIRILLLEDSAVDAELAAATLERLGQPLLIDRVDTREDFVAAVDRGVYDVILADYALPSFDGDAALAIVLERTPSTPFIFVSGVLGEEIAVDAMRKGATDFVVKQRMHRLPAAVSRAIEEVRQRRERQRMAAALHSLEDRLDRLIAATSSMVWSTDGAGRFVAPQPSLERLTGLPFDRYAGRGLLEAVHPDDRERVDLLWGRAVAGRTLFDTEFRLRQRDGSYRLVLARALPTLGEDGRVLEWLGTAIDIEDRRRAETALRDSETRLRLALEAGRLGSWELDPANGRLIASAACRAHFGRNPDAAFTFADMLSAVDPDDREALQVAAGLARDGGELDVEVPVAWPDGDRRWIQLRARAVPAAEDGDAARLIGVSLDVTDRRRAEEALRGLNETLETRVAERTGEMEAANRQLLAQIQERERVEGELRRTQRIEAIGQLTSGVAHDFNNLLTVVLGNVTLLERELGTESTAGRRLTNIRNAAERGARLTGQLLAYSRQQQLQPRPLDLNDTVQGMSGLLQSAIGSTVRIETVAQPGLWPALVDPTQIELVILNLAINARDAMKIGGSLAIETANAVLGPPSRPEEPPAGEYVMVSVTDSGSGMDEATLARAFEPFFTTKETGRGSGLGLSQVLGVAKQSGGGVRIDTRPGEGTVVRVYLPRAAALADTLPAGIEDSSAPLDGARILLVDDDSAVRAVTSQLLQDLGYTVVEAGSGGAALDRLARDGAFDLLLLDFAMPGMTGAEVAREVASRWPRLPVLFVTGYADTGALANAADERRVIQKPFQPEELATKVRNALAGARNPVVVPLRPAQGGAA